MCAFLPLAVLPVVGEKFFITIFQLKNHSVAVYVFLIGKMRKQWALTSKIAESALGSCGDNKNSNSET